jgi:hypothetical protein
MGFTTIVGLSGLALMLGFRHGIDWDHVTAIADLVGGEEDRKKGFMLTLWYAVGHEVVIVIFGALAILLGRTLPHWVDAVMERFVGMTLLILAAFLVISLLRGGEYVPMSRWRLLFTSFNYVLGWVARRLGGGRNQFNVFPNVRINRISAFFIGVIHGIGAETPTQLMMFATVSGLGSPLQGCTIVLSFVVGLLCSHMLLAFTTIVGYLSVMRHRRVIRGIGIATAAYSLCIGGIFTLGYASVLPTLL